MVMMHDVLDGSDSTDDYYTPDYAMDMVWPHIIAAFQDRDATRIWEPCCGQMHMVRYFQSHGYNNVIATDIKQGQDVLSWNPEPSEYDVIVTNPPYSLKTKFMKRLMGLGKPFAIIISSRIFDNRAIKELIAQDHAHFRFLFPNRRVDYIRKEEEGGGGEGIGNGKKSHAFFMSIWILYRIPLFPASASNNLIVHSVPPQLRGFGKPPSSHPSTQYKINPSILSCITPVLLQEQLHRIGVWDAANTIGIEECIPAPLSLTHHISSLQELQSLIHAKEIDVVLILAPFSMARIRFISEFLDANIQLPWVLNATATLLDSTCILNRAGTNMNVIIPTRRMVHFPILVPSISTEQITIKKQQPYMTACWYTRYLQNNNGIQIVG